MRSVLYGLFFLGSLAFAGETTHQVIGYYSQGNLSNPAQLPYEGEGFTHILRPRLRHFGSDGVMDLLVRAAYFMKHQFPGGERLQIGDVAAEHGGALPEHQSHQNGLDADIVYLRINHREQEPNGTAGFEENFVPHGKLSPNFDVIRNWAVLRYLVSTKRVTRIFVDQEIKNRLCSYTRRYHQNSEIADTLRRLRPYENHFNHFHIRLSCPASSPNCIAQEEPPLGTGCPGEIE